MTQSVRDIMSRQLALAHVDHSLAEAAKRTREADVGALPVVDGDELVRVVTDRDLVVRATARYANPYTAPVLQAMTRHVVFCHECIPSATLPR
jgi:CBS domain-containing protein